MIVWMGSWCVVVVEEGFDIVIRWDIMCFLLRLVNLRVMGGNIMEALCEISHRCRTVKLLRQRRELIAPRQALEG